jgi:hypothetical protein
MADGRHRLACVEERFHELDRLRLYPQLVGIDDPARQQQRVEVLRLGIV